METEALAGVAVGGVDFGLGVQRCRDAEGIPRAVGEVVAAPGPHAKRRRNAGEGRRHPDAVGIVSRTKVFSLAESLGGVESLIEVPQAMTHQSVEDSDAAVPADLVRLSCGIEAGEDLIADLAQAIGAS
jgi:hypothetical protein